MFSHADLVHLVPVAWHEDIITDLSSFESVNPGL